MNITPNRPRYGRPPNPGMLRGGRRAPRPSAFQSSMYNLFRGSSKRRQAGRTFNQSLDIGVIKNNYKRNAISKIPSSLALHMKDQAPLIWVTETQNQYDFESPSQGVFTGVTGANADLGTALQKCLRTGARGYINASGTYVPLAGFGGIGEGSAPTGFPSVGNDGVNNYSDIKFIVHHIRETHQIVNSSTNPIEFIFQFWKNKFDVSRVVPTTGVITDQVAEGWMPTDMSSVYTALFSGINQNAVGDGAIAGFNSCPPNRFGQSLSNYSLVKDHFKNVGTIRFTLKPGEQKNIYSSVRGPHVMNMIQFSNYESYRPLTSNWSIIARGGIVGDSVGTNVSHGSGQFQVYKRFEIKCQFAQRSLLPVKVMETSAAPAIVVAQQERINAETDRQHLYSEL